MDKQLLQKYFRNQCTHEEIEQVLDWFQTEEGQIYFEERLDRDMKRYADDENLLLHPDVPSDKLLQELEKKKKRKERYKRVHRYWFRAAVILLIFGAAFATGYWSLRDAGPLVEKESEIIYRTISTQEDQQRLITLGDGTRIHLNANSSVIIPENFPPDQRVIQLAGEAYFNVASDNHRPFSVHADQAIVRVLGTQFNVKIDSRIRQVQIAVNEGRVSLSGQMDETGRQAILTENTFALYDLDDGEILIERTHVDNYLSWISGNLFFYNEPLWMVSRYLERLYGVSIRFQDEQLRDLYLSTDIVKRDLVSVLNIISRTLGIEFEQDESNRTVNFQNSDNKPEQ